MNNEFLVKFCLVQIGNGSCQLNFCPSMIQPDSDSLVHIQRII